VTGAVVLLLSSGVETNSGGGERLVNFAEAIPHRPRLS
jgi:hypothetical protein